MFSELNGIADRIRTTSKAASLRGPITALISANQHNNPSEQVQAALMLALLYAEELKLDLSHELPKMARALDDSEPGYAHEIQAMRDYIRRHLAGRAHV